MPASPLSVTVELDDEEIVAGTLRTHERRGQIATFQYAERYLAHPAAYPLDPALPLGGGVYQPPAGTALANCFSDAAPDRWGQALMRRAERARAKATGATPRLLGPVDFLTEVDDRLRQGAIRLRDPAERALAPPDRGVPKIVSLGQLLSAADRLHESAAADDDDVRDLIAAGSSLGGARPKAAVTTDRGLALAKFPRADDRWDVEGWEYVASSLARRAGATSADAELHTVLGRHVVVLDRFDRRGSRRIGFASALTLVEASDMEAHSYLEIADAIERFANTADRDLEELFRRLTFSVLITNTDDHLRNHGFLRRGAGWDLAPAYDVNPNPETTGYQALAIDLEDATASIELVMAVAPAFRLGLGRARAILSDVLAAARHWRDAAAAAGIGRREIAFLTPAFEGREVDVARRIVNPTHGVGSAETSSRSPGS
jgi:serine/threonine-protein kinase HipA